MLSGNIIDIKHLAVHDGPGIRTTLFFKGCPLRCRWCHNPESQLTKRELGYWQKKCINCRKCTEVCSLHSFDEQGVLYIDHGRCTACGKCADVCPVNALEIYGRTVTLEEAAREMLHDVEFFRTSGGGCTLSGGEPLLQSKFAGALLQELKKHNIHTAVDTCGAVPWSAFEDVLEYTDLFLFDLKHPQSAPHKEFTGSDNEKVLANLYHLDQSGKPIEVRIPLIPGFNSSREVWDGFAEILLKLRSLSGVKLLPYHCSRFKYQVLGIDERMGDVQPCPDELTEEATKYFLNKQIKVLTN